MSKLLVNRLNKRITILKPSAEQDEYGEPIEGLTEVCKVWGAIEPLRGREYFAAQTENVDVTTRIRIRYRDDVDRTMVVRYKNIEFEVLHVLHPEYAKNELQLMCKERQ